MAGSGIGGWFGHLFLSDLVADSIGWPAGSPFQLKMEFANLAPGNTLQNVSNLLRPALLIFFLWAIRRVEAESGPDNSDQAFDHWRAPRVQAAGMATGIVPGGFGAGSGIGQPVLGTGIGLILSALLVWQLTARAAR